MTEQPMTTDPEMHLSPAEHNLLAALRAADGPMTGAELATAVRCAVGVRPARQRIWADLHALARRNLAAVDDQVPPGRPHLWRARRESPGNAGACPNG